MKDGGQQSEHHVSARLDSAFGRWATARKLADQALVRTCAILAILTGAAFMLGGLKPTIWFWGLIAIAAIVMAVALMRFVLQLLFYREILQDPWEG